MSDDDFAIMSAGDRRWWAAPWEAPLRDDPLRLTLNTSGSDPTLRAAAAGTAQTFRICY